MKKTKIFNELEAVTKKLVAHAQNLPSNEVNNVSENKWSVNQNLDHLILSLKPMNKALSLPKPLLKSLFKKPDRNLKTYDEVVAMYTEKLSKGGKATGKYVPKKSKSFETERLVKSYVSETKKLIKILSKWNEDQLDSYFLPHPLIGKLSIRELLYFTIYHTKHHLNTIKNCNNE